MGRLRISVERGLSDSGGEFDGLEVGELDNGSSLAKPPVVLGIGLPRSFSIPGIAIRRPTTERDIVKLLRQAEFDLLLVAAKSADDRIWNLLRLIRRHWPGLRWVLLSDDCSDAMEIQARSLGAICVTADKRTIEELTLS